METSEILQKTGLNQKEASVYLALLELGTAPVESIATKAGTKRPTTYLILDDLQQKGLVSVVPRAKKSLFTAESPEKIILELNKKQELVKRSLPELLALFNAKKDKPQVQLFSGKEGVKQVYEKIYNSLNVDFFGTVREAVNVYPEGLEYFIKNIRERKVKARDLITQSPEDIEYAKKATLGENYEVRFIPKYLSFPTDNAIFGDNVVFFSFHPTMFAVMITSKEVSQSLRSLFELAWQLGEPVKK